MIVHLSPHLKSVTCTFNVKTNVIQSYRSCENTDTFGCKFNYIYIKQFEARCQTARKSQIITPQRKDSSYTPYYSVPFNLWFFECMNKVSLNCVIWQCHDFRSVNVNDRINFNKTAIIHHIVIKTSSIGILYRNIVW